MVTHSFPLAIILYLGPFFLVGGVGIYLLFGLAPMITRREYRNDPRMQGEFELNITPGSISILDYKGNSSLAGGDVYEWWYEAKGLILLRLRSGACSIVSLSRLAEAQRAELRGLLASSLPKK